MKAIARNLFFLIGAIRYHLVIFWLMVICAPILHGDLLADEVNPSTVYPASYNGGKWRTNGTFSVFIDGNKAVGGEGPLWITINSNGKMSTEMDFPFRWKTSGGKMKILIEKNKMRDYFGTPSDIKYYKNSLTRSGSRISGELDCSFRAGSMQIRWIWSFAGKN